MNAIPAEVNELEEHVKVRTRYSGQHLRVSLVRARPLAPNILRGENDYDEVIAELRIAPGCRLVVEPGGLRVETI